jgi:hypothetical protein
MRDMPPWLTQLIFICSSSRDDGVMRVTQEAARLVSFGNETAKNDYWKDYGGRGIRVCARWRGKNGFRNFLRDMGQRPATRTLDRKNVNGNYSPRNCRGATRQERANDKRRASAFEEDGYLASEAAA